ncbi:hypothetical protein [Serratia sp. 14-2641]|uniref:hypothetical protein n=1 Tax=Serratia sp. 14-2641 TaxID=1841657 RepID=UPI00080F72BE|nr:hypothetical protein [Serratia sp. 14-2641]OCJ23782.1 hypothetical protein A6U95_28990 [Serratia sp. 14-2641]
MVGLIVIIVCIALSIFFYKKMVKILRTKGRGKLSTLFIALSSSSLVFIVSMMIGISNFFPEAQSSKSNEGGHIVNNTTAIESSLEIRIQEEINSLPEGSAKRGSAISVYKEYGVSNKDLSEALKKADCYNAIITKMKIHQSAYSYETKSWQSFKDFERDVGGDAYLKAEMDYRKRYNEEFGRNQKKLSNELALCTYNVAQSLPEHLPRPKPEEY